MNKVRITAIRQTVYTDLMAKYENPIEHTCDVKEGQQWISIDGQQPEGMCPSAWYSMREFVESLARGKFFFRWMDEESHECNEQQQRRLPSVQFLYRSSVTTLRKCSEDICNTYFWGLGR
jgi:uncharacterized repeat protein (TIGR04076 family)